MRYPILIEPAMEKTAYGVVVPDLPGCFSAGNTVDDAVANAEAAILMHLEALVDEDQPIPEPTTAELYVKDPEYAGWIRAVVDVDVASIQGPAQRINVTIPRRVLRAIDAAASRAHETRWGFLARAGLRLAKSQEPGRNADSE